MVLQVTKMHFDVRKGYRKEEKQGRKERQAAQERGKGKRKEPNFNILMLMTGLLITLVRFITCGLSYLCFTNSHTIPISESELLVMNM